MIRDMDLIRELMLKLESMPMRPGTTAYFSYADFEPEGELFIEGYSPEQVEYHLNQIYDAGLIEGGGSKPMNGIMFNALTWEGHDFVDSIRDAVVWEKTKKGALAAGGFTVELLKDLAKGFLKKQIENQTGISL